MLTVSYVRLVVYCLVLWCLRRLRISSRYICKEAVVYEDD